ncbi:MAG: sigma-54-dependent Fis family transcriptional regulator [Bdellovibrionales bacterium]|nr:sigma-54-dependent Fis family transcriptional regulator [Bdellovibrionales bacterium]
MPNLGRILVVDDEPNLRLVIQTMLERAGYEVVSVGDPQEALKIALEEDFDGMISDLVMPGMSGIELLGRLKRERSSLPIVMITAHGTIESAVNALKLGAFDFITKPFGQNDLLASIQKAIRTRIRSESEPTSRSQGSHHSLINDEQRAWIAKVSKTPSHVLILGESGTGKEWIAEEIHQKSPRADKPFMKVNCAAIPKDLIDAEIFGTLEKPGRLEIAMGGTLLLDEVSELPFEVQSKLLQWLRTESPKARLIFAAHWANQAALMDAVKAGKFREDLFYEINVMNLRLSSLREIPDQIPGLVQGIIQELAVRFGKKVTSVDDRVMGRFQSYEWPGNLRQLENVLERMVLLSEGQVIAWDDLPEELKKGDEATGGATTSFKEAVRVQTQSIERVLILKALDESGGNVTRSAEKLGLSRKGLQLKMKELGIRRDLHHS